MKNGKEREINSKIIYNFMVWNTREHKKFFIWIKMHQENMFHEVFFIQSFVRVFFFQFVQLYHWKELCVLSWKNAINQKLTWDMLEKRFKIYKWKLKLFLVQVWLIFLMECIEYSYKFFSQFKKPYELWY